MKLKIRTKRSTKKHLRLKPGENLLAVKNDAFKFAAEAETKSKYRRSEKDDLMHLFI